MEIDSLKAKLISRINALSASKILVVGDCIIDEMIYGQSHRISREAPVIILKHKRSDIVLGGAANAAHNIAKLGTKQVSVVGLSGQDSYADQLKEALQRDGICAEGLITDPDRPTTTKTRISGIANHSVTQQILRIDRESSQPVSQHIETKLLDRLTDLVPAHDGILISDYGLGVITPKLIAHCLALKKKHNLILAVDSQQDLSAFYGATVVTPNQPEAEKNAGFLIESPESLTRAGKIIGEKTNADAVLITCGASGMCLFENTQGTPPVKIPVFNRSEVFDVTGAGDTVISTLMLALSTGASFLEAAVLGNLAASLVVKRYGAATTSQAELIEALEQLDADLFNSLFSAQPVEASPSVL